MRKGKEMPKKHAAYCLGKPRRAADCLPPGGTPPPARFFIMALRGNLFFLALVDLCDLGNMDICKGGERERDIYWIAYEIITHLCTMT